MKINITTDRMPWVNGKARANGEEIDVSAQDADALIKSGFATAVEAPKPKAVRKIHDA